MVVETAAWRFRGIVWHDEGISPVFRLSAWMLLPLLVGVAIDIKPGFEMVENLIGLIKIFDNSSLRGFDVKERGWIGEFELIIVMRGGDEDTPMMGDKFDDWKVEGNCEIVERIWRSQENLQSQDCRNKLEMRWRYSKVNSLNCTSDYFFL